MTSLVLILLLAFAAPAAAGGTVQESQVSPIQKVVQMLNDMLAKSKAEKDDETVRFAQYKVFCEMTEKEKKTAISEGTELVAQLKAEIGASGAEAAKLAKETAVINENVASFEAELKELKLEREKSHKDFLATHKDYTESIESVEMAKKKLAEPKSLLETSDSLLQLSSRARVPPKAKQVIASFLQMSDPIANLMQDEVEFKAGAPEAATYSSSSGGVIDMVEKLGDKFEGEQEEAEKRESNAQHNFKMMQQDLTKQIESGKEESSDKMATKSEKETAKAQAEGDLEEASGTLAEDTQFLSDLVAECEQKSLDYAKRQEVRAGEIEAVKKAIEIMTSDAVTGGSALPQVGVSLAQLRSSSSSRATSQGLAASFLADKAKEYDSRILEMVADRTTDEPFKKVTKMIKDMITKLMEEANEEAEHKGFCDAEMGTNKVTRDAKTDEAANLKATIDELTADLSKIAQQVGDINAAITAADAALAKATGEREAEKEKNQATISDAKVAQEATAQALNVLKEFYAKAANPAPTPEQPKGPIKWDTRAIAIIKGGAALAQVPGAPEMESGSYSGQESGGVVGMLEVIESDFARVVSETTSSEADSQGAFEQFQADSAKDKAVKGADLKHFAESTTEKETELAETKKDMKVTSEELAAAMAYYEKLKPSCVDAGVSYEERVAARKAEIESLQEALKILSE